MNTDRSHRIHRIDSPPALRLHRRQLLTSALAGAAGLAGLPSARAAGSADPARTTCAT